MRTGYIALKPLPELKDLDYVKKELNEDLDRFVKRGVVLLGAL